MRTRSVLNFGLALILVLGMFTAPPAAYAGETLTMATTTSTDDTGLLDSLAPLFTTATGIELKWVATGTGKALKIGENCDADVLLVHAPAAEKKYVADGFGLNRVEVMYNDFVLIGPVADPAGVRGKDAAGALAAIRGSQAVFVSRGDDSGTHKKEQGLWQSLAGAVPDKEPWYQAAGQGMLATIAIAAEKNGYTLTDRGTFIKYEAGHRGAPPLVILTEKDAALLNQYAVIEVNPARCPNVHNEQAQAFSRWLSGREGQEAVAAFTLAGKQLFVPNAAR